MINIYYSHLHKAQFLSIPKTGSTTVKASLSIDDENKYQFRDQFIYNYPCFTVIRHTYPRIISAFHELKRSGHPRALVSFEKFIENIENFGFFDHHLHPQSWYLYKLKDKISKIYTLENGLLDFMLDYSLPELKIRNTTPNPTILLDKALKKKIDVLYFQDLKMYSQTAVTY